ncbi:MAG TPA: 2-oxoglutarate dehydrogenase E1 component [Spirochaetia bacterium]|nr:2-oxoglutarate dehydrogenase E1 component [Spirochaetia bacterium]
MSDLSVLSSVDIPWIEELHQKWQADPKSVGPQWNEFFQNQESNHIALKRRGAAATGEGPVPTDMAFKQSRVDSLLWGYRDVGYLYAHLNPLAPAEGEQRNYYAEPAHTYEQLTLSEFGLSESDLPSEFWAGSVFSRSKMRLAEIINALRETYCSTVAVEFLHIQNKPIRRWLIQQMESSRNKPSFGTEKKKVILDDLLTAEEFEHFMHTAFIGQKRFSLEGAETVIPALHHLVDSAPDMGISEIIMGMTHRGRLTVLNRILNKPPVELFREFEGIEDPGDFTSSGDVRYHLGFQREHSHPDGRTVRVNLVANPSHLESVDPVVQGMARAVQRERGDTERKQIVPIILHGDAAFSGQGIVEETFNLSTLRGYKTGGTIHVIINNQIGFTTSARDARSTFFPTDVAKMLPVPVFHVNGDDPEAVVYTMDLAVRFRQEFGRDVVVDIMCYRKYGHNEGDDPSFTHPLMYKIIERKKSQPVLYTERLIAQGIVTKEETDRTRSEFRDSLKSALQEARTGEVEGPVLTREPNAWEWGEHVAAPPDDTLRFIAEKLTTVPPGFHVHPKLKRIIDEKATRFATDGTVDWGFAESLAFGSLLLEGIPVRLSGQDSARGTFSQRHLVWWDTETLVPQPYIPLANLAQDQGRFSVYDSPLSEYSVLGFEYGHALGQPRSLVMWEAQYGDFSNGGQVIIDNYVAAGEAKWGTISAITLLLPHGFEGQGPEHSSGHLERFLMLCAHNNIQVCNCTTPAQYFHMLRRQVKRSFRKPLIVMTPKSLLRHPKALSPISDLSKGEFQEVLDDPARPAKPRRLLFCSGKIFYDLLKAREDSADLSTAIVRIEQLYPFPAQRLADILETYRSARERLWVQEEPRNRGAWTFVKERFERELAGVTLSYVGRDEAASPATGSHQVHAREQEEILQEALGRTSGLTKGGASAAIAAVRSRNGAAGNGVKGSKNGGSSAKQRNYAK